MSVSIQLTNKQIYIDHDRSFPHAARITLNTTHWLIAKIQNFIACIFCCLNLDTALKIKVGTDEAYVSHSALSDLFHLAKDETIEEERLKELVRTYFQEKQLLPTPSVPEQSPITLKAKLSDPIAEKAERLADKFLAEKSETEPHSGYHVHIVFSYPFPPSTKDTSEQTYIEIEPWGTKNQPITPAPLETECTCCAYKFEHTRKMNNPLTNRLSDAIRAFDMFAIFSKSNNLLIIPDTQKTGIEKAAFPHLFALDKAQLCKVFSAIFIMHAALQKEFPSYQPNIVAHVGQDGSQTEGLLHMRFEKLPPEILKLSPFF